MIRRKVRESQRLNYFNYFTELEEVFVRRRAKHLWLGPVDWALMEVWKERGIPLHVAIRGIERAFDSYESKPRHRTVKSLLYCREEVEAQFAEWLEGRTGSADSTVSATDEGKGDALPFPREVIREHLKKAVDALDAIATRLSSPLDAEFLESVQRAISLLQALGGDLDILHQRGVEMLEQSLTHIEKMLDEAIKVHASPETLADEKSYAERQLSDFKKRMDKDTYAQTCENVFIKRLREVYGLPRLSLFYL